MASGVELFRLMAKLVMDTSEFDASIAGAKKSAEGLGGAFDGAESKVTKLSSALNVMSKVGGAVSNALKGVVGAGLGLVETSASLDALEQSMASTFAGVEEEAGAALERVGEANNIAMLRLQESGLSFFRQFTSAGADSTEALAGMEKMLMLAADGAAAYDKSLEDVAAMMRSFVRGNVEAGESIGLFINQTTREELAGTLFDGKKWDELTEKERQFALMHHINASYLNSNVLGQGAREMNNWSNVVGNLSSVWTEAQATMGNKIREALIPALMDLTKWIEDNPDIWEGLGETFGHIAKAMVSAFQSLVTFISNNEDKIIGFIDSLNALFSGEKTLAQVLFGGGQSQNVELRPNVEGEAALRAYANKEIDFETLSGAVGEGVAQSFNDALAAGVDLEAAITNALTDAQVILDKHPLIVDVQAQFNGLLDWGLNLLGFNSHAKGLDYVPFDDYPAMLHRGETVLNRVEAEDWRAAKRGEGMGFDPDAIGSAVKAALAGVSISMDGRTVGALVTPYVSREQAAEAWRRR